ncbi:unnamed protein product [Rhizopus stolonifer]
MGKRKTKRKVQKKLKDKLDTQFTCVFCNHENSVECKIDHPNKLGHLNCKVCSVTWQSQITYLDEPVDVYSGWIDACEDVNRRKRLRANANKSGAKTPPLDYDEDEDED